MVRQPLDRLGDSLGEHEDHSHRQREEGQADPHPGLDDRHCMATDGFERETQTHETDRGAGPTTDPEQQLVRAGRLAGHDRRQELHERTLLRDRDHPNGGLASELPDLRSRERVCRRRQPVDVVPTAGEHAPVPGIDHDVGDVARAGGPPQRGPEQPLVLRQHAELGAHGQARRHLLSAFAELVLDQRPVLQHRDHPDGGEQHDEDRDDRPEHPAPESRRMLQPPRTLHSGPPKVYSSPMLGMKLVRRPSFLFKGMVTFSTRRSERKKFAFNPTAKSTM